MKLSDYASVLRGGWVLILIATMLGALVGWGLSALQPRTYNSTTGLYVSISDGTDPTSLYQMGEYMRSQMVTYAALAEKRIVLDPVAEQLGGDLTTEQLADMVSVDVPSESYIMQVEVSSDDPQLSADASLAIAENLEAEVEGVAPQYQEQSLIDLSIVDRPETAADPESIPMGLWIGAGAIVGLVIGLLLAFLRHSVRSAPRPQDGRTARTAQTAQRS